MKNYNDKIIYRKQRQLETVATIFINGFVFIILFFLNPGHKYSEIQKSCLENKNLAHEFPENPVANIDLLLSESARVWEGEEGRTKSIDDKSKILLTVSSILIAGTFTLSRYIDHSWILLFSMFFPLISVFLILIYFKIHNIPVINLKDVDWNSCENDLKVALAHQYIDCANYLSPRNDYRAGIYRTASRSILIAAFFFIFVFAIAIFCRSEDTELHKIIPKNTELVRDFRDPEGSCNSSSPRGQS